MPKGRGRNTIMPINNSTYVCHIRKTRIGLEWRWSWARIDLSRSVRKDRWKDKMDVQMSNNKNRRQRINSKTHKWEKWAETSMWRWVLPLYMKEAKQWQEKGNQDALCLYVWASNLESSFFSNSRCSLLCGLCLFNVGDLWCILLICVFRGFISILHPHYPPYGLGWGHQNAHLCIACEAGGRRQILNRGRRNHFFRTWDVFGPANDDHQLAVS